MSLKNDVQQKKNKVRSKIVIPPAVPCVTKIDLPRIIVKAKPSSPVVVECDDFADEDYNSDDLYNNIDESVYDNLY